jgi:hypothetical protein
MPYRANVAAALWPGMMETRSKNWAIDRTSFESKIENLNCVNLTATLAHDHVWIGNGSASSLDKPQIDGGPFIASEAPVIEAALLSGIHYLDVAV